MKYLVYTTIDHEPMGEFTVPSYDDAVDMWWALYWLGNEIPGVGVYLYDDDWDCLARYRREL